MGLRTRSDAGFQPTRQAYDNAYVESFNGRLRDECLNAIDFDTLLRNTFNRHEVKSKSGSLPP